MLPVGVGSNLIVRDGGISGVVVRLGRGFNGIRIEDGRVVAGAAALDAHVARRAGEAGIDVGFLRTIPGAIGGAARMNAGCYGTYVADVFVSARAVTRDGVRTRVEPKTVRRVVSPETAQRMLPILEAVAERGTAKLARISGYTVAGKTGTADKLVNGRYVGSMQNVSFLGFAPSRNPALTMIVMIDTPRVGSDTGGAVAASSNGDGGAAGTPAPSKPASSYRYDDAT